MIGHKKWRSILDPQGLVLGPLLFHIYINDLQAYIKYGTYLYADDTRFFQVHSNIKELKVSVQSALDRASHWFKDNGWKIKVKTKPKILFLL